MQPATCGHQELRQRWKLGESAGDRMRMLHLTQEGIQQKSHAVPEGRWQRRRTCRAPGCPHRPFYTLQSGTCAYSKIVSLMLMQMLEVAVTKVRRCRPTLARQKPIALELT